MERLGFTLVELLVTVAIIGILATISIASYQNYKQSVRDSVAKSLIHDAYVSINAGTIDIGGYLPEGNIYYYGDGTTSVIDGSSSSGPPEPGDLTDYTLDELMPGFEHKEGVAIAVDPRHRNSGHHTPAVYGRHCSGSADKLGCGHETQVFVITPDTSGAGDMHVGMPSGCASWDNIGTSTYCP